EVASLIRLVLVPLPPAPPTRSAAPVPARIRRRPVRPLPLRIRPADLTHLGRPLMTTAAPEIWFLTGSQEMYGPETLRQVAEQSRQAANQLADSGDGPAHATRLPARPCA